MYTSKHYTCEQIDQRLFEGYYDDFVAAGFVGTKQEFWQFVLSISEKVEKKEGYGLSQNDFTNELKAKLDSIQEGAKTVTKVSELENDLGFQTQEEVAQAISDLINGADAALDTLKELAEALGNDPNFAATIASKLGELRTLLDGEISRASTKEAELELKINELSTKLDAKTQEILDLIESKGNDTQSKIDNLQEQVTKNKEDILTFTSELKNQLLQAKAYTDEKVLAEHDRARDAESKLQDDLSTLANVHTTDKGEILAAISAEAATRESTDSQLSARIDQLNSAHSQDIQNIQNDLATEITQRQAADNSITDSITTETNNRISQFNTLSSKIDSEKTRAQAAETTLDGLIASEISARESADGVLDSKIDNVRAALQNSDTNITSKLAEEIQNRKDADTAIDNKKVDKREGYTLSKNDFTDILLDKLNNIEKFANYVTKTSQLTNDSDFQTSEQVNAAIEKVIALAPDALDTLKELADALGNDPNFATTISTKLTQLAEQVNQETDNREKADAALQTNIDKVNANITTANDLLKTQLKEYADNIASSLTTLIEANSEKISTEVSDRKADTTEVKALITAEAESRERADIAQQAALEDVRAKVNDLNVSLTEKVATIKTELGTKIDTNTQNIKTNADAIKAIQDQFTAGSTDNTSKFANLEKKIADETAARTLGDQTLDTKITTAQNDINTEVIRATTAESVLQTKIDTLTEAYKTADATLKADLIKNISDFKSAVDTEVNDLKTVVSDESLSRQTADSALDARISALETTSNTKIEAVKEKVNEVSDNLTREVNRATNEEKALKSLLDTLNQNHTDDLAAINSTLGTKVDKVEGKGLSKNDFTDVLKNKLEAIEEHANYITKLSELVNDTHYQTEADVNLIIQSVIGAAPEALDTLKELADAIANDPNFAATLNNKITELNTKVNEQGKDVELVKEQLNDIKERDNAQDSLIAQNVANIQRNLELIQAIRTDYYAALDPLNNLINQTIKDLAAVKKELQEAIDAEAATRELEDGILDGKITTEREAREAADQQFTEDLAEEVTSRKSITGIDGNTIPESVQSTSPYMKTNIYDTLVNLDAKLHEEETRRRTQIGLSADGSDPSTNLNSQYGDTNYLGEATNLIGATKTLDTKIKSANDALAAEVTRATTKEGEIDNYTVNSKKISTNPVLSAPDIPLNTSDISIGGVSEQLTTPVSEVISHIGQWSMEEVPFSINSNQTDTQRSYRWVNHEGNEIPSSSDRTPSITIPSAGTDYAGLMSAADKTYLDSVPGKLSTFDTELGTVKDICDNNTDDIANEVTRAKDAEKAINDTIVSMQATITSLQNALAEATNRITTLENNLKLIQA